MKWLRKNWITILLIVILLAGLGLLLYPSVANYWNSFHQSRAIAGYADAVAGLDAEEYARILSEAQAYNEEIGQKGMDFHMDAAELARYDSILDITGTGIMGYIEIPQIRCYLPIYHSTDEAVLQIAIGHIAGTSLPVGGYTAHCVLTGHRGLPSAKLFTDLDKMVEGDIFMIRTLDETLTYEVDQIRIVLPEDMSSLQLEQGQDLCTLVTCTPYGVNTHRLLVRGHRIENPDESGELFIIADASQIEAMIVATIVAIPILIALIIGFLAWSRRKPVKTDRAKFEEMTGRGGKPETGETVE